MAGKNKKGPKKPCREELIVLQGVPPSEIAKHKTKKEKLEEMARAAEAKVGTARAVSNCAGKKGKTGRMSKKARKGRAVEKKMAKEEVDDSDSSESSNVNEIEWNFNSDFEDKITTKDKLTKQLKTKGIKIRDVKFKGIKTKDVKTSMKGKSAEKNKTKGSKSTKDDESIDWKTVNKKRDTYKNTKKGTKKEKAEEDNAQQQEKQKEENDDMEAKKMAKKEKKKIAKARKKAKKQPKALEEAKAAKEAKLLEEITTWDPAKDSEAESEVESQIEFNLDVSISRLKPLDRANQIDFLTLQTKCINCDTINVMLYARIEKLEAQRKPLQLSLNKAESWISGIIRDNYIPETVKMLDGGGDRNFTANPHNRYGDKEAEAFADRQWFQDKIRPIDELIAAYKLEMETGVLTCKILRYAQYVHLYGSKFLTLDGLEIISESEVPLKDKTRYEHVTMLFKEMQKLKSQIELLEAEAESKGEGSEDKEAHRDDGPSPVAQSVSGAMIIYMVMLTMWFLATVFLWLAG